MLILAAVFTYNTLSERFKPEVLINPSHGSASADSASEDVPQDTAEQAAEPIAAPDFTVYDGEGKAVKLSDFFGTPVVVNFWASWCPPCRSEMPHFDKVFSEEKDGVAFLMVDLSDGQSETVEDGKKYIADNGFTFPVFFDNDQDAAFTYGIRSIPTTLFIDREGNVAAGVEGALEEETLRMGLDLIR